MPVNQIYQIVNEVFQQSTGMKNLAVIDTTTLIAAGSTLEELGKYDIYLNNLARRIGLTIDGYRVYTNKFSDFRRNNMQWGGIVQKLYAAMPEAVTDPAWEIGHMDGQSVDQYIINNPRVSQKFFEKESPYSFFITTATEMLRDAFLGPAGANQLMSYVFGQVQNRIELTHEELGRLCLATFMVSTASTQVINLLTIYNNLSGKSIANAKEALFDRDFLRWTIGFISEMSDNMEEMSVLFNGDGVHRFTPMNRQRFVALSRYVHQMQTVVQYEAFNLNLVTKAPNIALASWQAQKSGTSVTYGAWDWDTISTININGKTMTNVLGIIYDYEAMGTFRQWQRTATTPENASGLYYNTFWHEKPLWFNDHSENALVFTIN